MKKLKKINNEDNLAQMFLLFMGLYVILTGILLFEADKSGVRGFYTTLTSLLSLDAWGIVFITSGLMLLASAFQRGQIKYLSMFIGGVLGGILLILYAIASFDYNPNLAIGARYIVVGAFSLIIACLGGRQLWIERTTKEK